MRMRYPGKDPNVGLQKVSAQMETRVSPRVVTNEITNQ
jgi:hypothetical protein